ncbi:hypothetical protein MXB_4407, partial [Myxobolus squamalis]
MTNELNLNLEEKDFINLIDSYSIEISKEVLMELVDLRKDESFLQELKETKQPNQFETKKMAEYVNMIKNSLVGFEALDPDPERFSKVLKAVHDAIACYTIIYEEKKRATRQKTLT